jgi:hypothetical protein
VDTAIIKHCKTFGLLSDDETISDWLSQKYPDIQFPSQVRAWVSTHFFALLLFALLQ